MADISQIGGNIRILREQKGLTQRALADNVLVSFQAISAWERGLSVPDLENAVRLAEYFGVSVDALLTQNGRELFVGIDGDSAGTEFVLFDKSGTVKRIERQEGANPNDRDMEYSIRVLIRGLEQLLGNQVPKAIFAGIAGMSQADYRKAIAARLAERFHTNVYVDLDAANVLSLGEDPENSMAVICGTGSCVYVRKGEKQYHFGGWGYLFDQAGSGYDVGKDAIRCTLAAEDGLQQDSVLTGLVRQALGGNAFDHISTIYKKGSPYIAGFARYVLQAAKAGDETAMTILRENAERLSMLIRDAIRNHGMPAQLIATGDFLSNDIFRELVEQYAGVRLTFPETPTVYGACIEALRAERLLPPAEFRQSFTESYKMASC